MSLGETVRALWKSSTLGKTVKELRRASDFFLDLHSRAYTREIVIKDDGKVYDSNGFSLVRFYNEYISYFNKLKDAHPLLYKAVNKFPPSKDEWKAKQASSYLLHGPRKFLIQP